MIEWDSWYKNEINGRPTKALTLTANLLPYLTAAGVKSALDVGCGRGHLLEIFGKSGIATTGTEIVEELLRNDLAGRAVLPLDLAALTAERTASDWDFVTFVDVLQFVPEAEAVAAVAWAANAAHGFAVAMSTEGKGLQTDVCFWGDVIERAAAAVASPCTHIGAKAWVIWITR